VRKGAIDILPPPKKSYGLLDETERELEALVAANPRSQIAKSLWLDLRSKHQRP